MLEMKFIEHNIRYGTSGYMDYKLSMAVDSIAASDCKY